MFSKEIFSKRLVALRKSFNVSQSVLAEAIGVNRTTITHMEKGIRACSVEVLCILADYFDVSLDYLVGRSDDPQRR